MKDVIKRDGTLEKFQPFKIEDAIKYQNKKSRKARFRFRLQIYMRTRK